MKLLNLHNRNSDLQQEMEEQDGEKPIGRRRRTGIFSRFRRSVDTNDSKRTKSGIYVSWKNAPLITADDDNISSRKTDTILRASSIATAEMTIPTDTSMEVTSTATTDSSCFYEGNASFRQATEPLIDSKEVLIPTVDGQIETQQMECLQDQHLIGPEVEDERSLEESSRQDEDTDRYALQELDEDILEDILSQSTGSQQSDCSSVFFEYESNSHENQLDLNETELIQLEAVALDDAVISSSDEEVSDEEEEDDDDQDDISECDEEEESLEDEAKNISFLQALFLPDDDDDDYDYDDSSSSTDDDEFDGDEKSIVKTPLSIALEAFDDFAVESIYNASVLLLGPPQHEKKRRKRAPPENHRTMHPS